MLSLSISIPVSVSVQRTDIFLVFERRIIASETDAELTKNDRETILALSFSLSLSLSLSLCNTDSVCIPVERSRKLHCTFLHLVIPRATIRSNNGPSVPSVSSTVTRSFSRNVGFTTRETRGNELTGKGYSQRRRPRVYSSREWTR